VTTCTQHSALLAEPLTATVPRATTWLLLEQPGPWGAKALTSSHLDPALGRALERAAAGSGVRVALIRRPGRHADPRGPGATRRVFLAHTAPDAPWVRTADLAGEAETAEGSEGPGRPGDGADARGGATGHGEGGDGGDRHGGDGRTRAGGRSAAAAGGGTARGGAAGGGADSGAGAGLGALARLDFAALGAGDHGGFGTAYDGPPLGFVCTNGRRDRCCAVHGRPLAAELAASAEPGTVWETTHLGGHRFAPTMLVLPHGYLYGRLTGPRAKSVLEAARLGLVTGEGCRGRSAWDRPGQAAELAVRERTGEDRADALAVTSGTPGPDGRSWTVEVAHRDGRRWLASVVQREALPPRPESCGGALGTPLLTEVTAVAAVGGDRADPPA
jgi:hypothetical protein